MVTLTGSSQKTVAGDNCSTSAARIGPGDFGGTSTRGEFRALATCGCDCNPSARESLILYQDLAARCA